MNLTTALAAFDDKKYLHDPNHILVVTKSGCEYAVSKDVIEVATDDFRSSDGFIYGTRLNGSVGGPFRRSTQDQIRWFYLSNVALKEEKS